MTDPARPSMPRRAGPLAAACGSALLAVACGAGSAATTTTSASPLPPTPAGAAASAAPAPAVVPLVTRLASWSADLHTAPVAIPLRFQAPTIGVDIPMEAVGLTPKDAMDAPEGDAGDPVWNQGFWYRGGVEPGQPGVATIAGHLDDTLGRPAAFWNLRKLVKGDIVQVVDARTGEVIRFKVTDAHVYTLAESQARTVLNQLFGTDAAVAQPPTFPQDGIARLSLVTCAGVFTRGEYDHRYIVYTERVGGRGSAASPATPTAAPAG